MDTITHGITGALIGNSLFSERENRIAILAVTIGSVYPDSDTFASWFYHNRLAFLEIHRGVTHSLIMLPVFALLFGGVTSLLTRRRYKWLFLSLFYAIGIGSHILLDLITSYGTMIWSPISIARVSWDTTFIVDVTFTAIALLPQLIAWVYSDPQRTRWRGCAVWVGMVGAGIAVVAAARLANLFVSAWTVVAAGILIAAALWAPSSLAGRGYQWDRAAYCRVGVAVLAIYLGFCAVAHRAALGRVERFASASGLASARIAALPSPPSLLRWSGLLQTNKGIYRGSIDLAASSQPGYDFFPNAENNQFLEKAESLPDAKTFLWFARFPWVTYQWNDGLQIVEIRDIQFFLPSRRANTPFTFQVLLDRQGRVLSSGLLRQ